jgi:hypothetical protein
MIWPDSLRRGHAQVERNLARVRFPPPPFLVVLVAASFGREVSETFESLDALRGSGVLGSFTDPEVFPLRIPRWPRSTDQLRLDAHPRVFAVPDDSKSRRGRYDDQPGSEVLAGVRLGLVDRKAAFRDELVRFFVSSVAAHARIIAVAVGRQAASETVDLRGSSLHPNPSPPSEGFDTGRRRTA